MQLISSIHKFVFENVEQAKKTQLKFYASRKGLHMFEGFEGKGVKGKKKNLTSSWERPYVFVTYKDGKGSHNQDEGGKTCIIKDLDEKHWEKARPTNIPFYRLATRSMKS